MGARIPNCLNRFWRIAATGFCFVTFGVGGLLLTLLATPLLWLCIRTRTTRKRIAQRLISAACRLFVSVMHYSGVLDYSINGQEYLQRSGTLFVANHPSLIDAVLLIAFMPEVDCVTNQHLWQNPFTGGPIRLAGYISNGTGPELNQRCCESLQFGNKLIIFPEGTRTRPGQPLDFQRGAANIAVHANVDVVPVTIILKQTTLTKGAPWYRVPSQKAEITISVDAPIGIRHYIENTASYPLAARKLTSDLKTYYNKRLARAGRLPENDLPKHTRQ